MTKIEEHLAQLEAYKADASLKGALARLKANAVDGKPVSLTTRQAMYLAAYLCRLELVEKEAAK